MPFKELLQEIDLVCAPACGRHTRLHLYAVEDYRVNHKQKAQCDVREKFQIRLELFKDFQ